MVTAERKIPSPDNDRLLNFYDAARVADRIMWREAVGVVIHGLMEDGARDIRSFQSTKEYDGSFHLRILWDPRGILRKTACQAELRITHRGEVEIVLPTDEAPRKWPVLSSTTDTTYQKIAEGLIIATKKGARSGLKDVNDKRKWADAAFAPFATRG